MCVSQILVFLIYYFLSATWVTCLARGAPNNFTPISGSENTSLVASGLSLQVLDPLTPKDCVFGASVV